MKETRVMVMFVMMAIVVSMFGRQAQVSVSHAVADYGLHNPNTDVDGTVTWDCVYFGSYWQSDTNGDGTADQNDEMEPIKWRVLSVDGEDAFLLADKCLDCQSYDTQNGVSATWENSTLRKWLNNEFYNTAFNTTEKKAVKTVTVNNFTDEENTEDVQKDTEDTVSLLSLDEIKNGSYGFSDEERVVSSEAKATLYADERGLYSIENVNYLEYAGNRSWWLRTISTKRENEIFAREVSNSGHSWGSTITTGMSAVRPAIHIDLSSTVWKKAGTISSVGLDKDSIDIDKVIKKQTTAVPMPQFDKNSIVHEGKDGDISWAIDANGCLSLEGNGNYQGLSKSFVIIGEEHAKYPEWLDYSKDIVAAKVNIRGITNCSYMFYGCYKMRVIDLKSFDTSKVTSMEAMFLNCTRLRTIDVSKFITSKVKTMESMFDSCQALEDIDVSSFDTSNVANMDYMFSNCDNLEKLDLSNFNTSGTTKMNSIFYSCNRLRKLDISSIDLTNGEKKSVLEGLDDLYCLIEIKTPINLNDKYESELPVSNSNYTHWKDGTGKIYKNIPCGKKSSIVLTRKITNSDVIVPLSGKSGKIKWEVDKQGTLAITGNGECKYKYARYPEWHEARNYIKSCVVNITGITDASYMFADLPYLETISFKKFDTSKVTNMEYMFLDDISLKNLDVSNFDTSNVTDMGGFFANCFSIEKIDLTKFQTQKVTDFSYMFSGCHKLKRLDLTSFSTTNMDDIDNMFETCSNLQELELGKFSTKKISWLQCIFMCCHKLTELDLSSWNLENVPKNESDETWSSFLGGMNSLSQIRTPVNLKVKVALPKGNWKDGNGKSYTNLPMNQNESIFLKNTEKSSTASIPTTKISKVKAMPGGKVKLTFNKVKKVNGYQIIYATNKKFKKKKTILSTKTSVTLKKLKKKKTYYIKVRAYTINGKKKLYGKWSNLKKIKTSK